MNSKKTIHLYYLASVLFYIVAITKFFSIGFSSGVVWLCLGSAFLCIGSTNQIRNKNNEIDDENNK